MGIVVFDEVDKLKMTKGSKEKDISGGGVQESLLKLMEGSTIEVSYVDPQSNDSKTVLFDTSNLLFVMCGAFTNLENIVTERLTNEGEVQHLTDHNIIKHTKPKDFFKCGMMEV